MSNEIVFAILFFLVAAGSIFVLLTLAKEISHKISAAEDFVEKANQWPATDGVITELGFNLDYPWPEGENLRTAVDLKWLNQQRVAYEDNSIYHQTLIRYTYIVDGESRTSRSIQIVPCKEHVALIYKLRVGDQIPVRYNPSNPSECFIKKNSAEDLKVYGWMLMQDLKPTLAICLASSLIFFILALSL
jgi:hypothetical protein